MSEAGLARRLQHSAALRPDDRRVPADSSGHCTTQTRSRQLLFRLPAPLLL